MRQTLLLRCWTSLRTVVHSYQMYRYVQIFRRLGTMQREVEGKTMNALSTELGIWACDTLCSSSQERGASSASSKNPETEMPNKYQSTSGTLEVWVPISMRLTYSIDRGFAGRQFNRPLRICIHIRLILASFELPTFVLSAPQRNAGRGASDFIEVLLA